MALAGTGFTRGAIGCDPAMAVAGTTVVAPGTAWHATYGAWRDDVEACELGAPLDGLLRGAWPTVRVVGVAPGLTLTSEWLQGDDFAKAHTLSPLGRSSTPQDVAATVAFALANRSMTGTTLLVDGGQHLQRFERDFSMM